MSDLGEIDLENSNNWSTKEDGIQRAKMMAGNDCDGNERLYEKIGIACLYGVARQGRP